MSKKPELVAPAGSFMSAYYAFEAGADAVYLGLQNHSARKTAQNFSYTELSKIKLFAVRGKKQIYVACNTVIKENEIQDLLSDILVCQRLDIDGLILQDAGLVDIIRNNFPGMPIHASTQMAIHNRRGVEKARELGIKRIILPRELSFDSVRKLRCDFPSMEFEVFIHGALCYSYSGLCLASGLLSGKSGNRGECRQVCRLEFACAGKQSYYLSCKDLFAGRNVSRLIDAGVDSFKIEGRLKPPEFVYNTVRLYRYIIDHPKACHGSEYKHLLANSEFVFSREKTNGYLFGDNAEKIITEIYARSMGHLAGKVIARTESGFSFTSDSDIAINDVLQFFLNKSEKLPFKLPVRKVSMRNDPSTTEVSIVTVESEKIPEPGQEIFKVYAKGLELAGIRHEHFDRYKKNINVNIVLTHNGCDTINIVMNRDNRDLVYTHPCVFTNHRDKGKGLELVKKTLTEENGTISAVVIDSLQLDAGLAPHSLSVPNRLLRMIKNDFFLFLSELDRDTDARIVSAILERNDDSIPEKRAPDLGGIIDFVRMRENLNPRNTLVPFYSGGEIDAASVASIDRSFFIPMKPIVDDTDISYFDNIRLFIERNPQLLIYLGINNIHHLGMIEEMAGHRNVRFFIDLFFYIANSFTLRFLEKVSSKIAFGYYWIEGDAQNFELLERQSAFPLIKIGPTFRPPYFFHAGAFAQESLGIESSVPENNEHYELSYENFNFEVIAHNNATYIIR